MSHSFDPALVKSIDCNATVRRLWDYLDVELDPVRAEEVARHLRGCDACREHFSFADHFLAALHESWPVATTAAPDAGSDDTESLRTRIVARLDAEGVRVA